MSEDARFSSMHTAPTFKKGRIDKKKIVVDDRFKNVLTDDKFRVVPSQVDKYGRKKKKEVEQELSAFYAVEDGEQEKPKSQFSTSGVQKNDIELRMDYLNRLARGEVSENSSSSDSGGDSDEDDDDEAEGTHELPSELESAFDIPGDEIIEAAESSKRLAIQNCDWDNLRAEDLM